MIEKTLAGYIIPAFFVLNFWFYSIVFYCNVLWNIGKGALLLRITTSKSKNAESFYISKGYINDKGVSTSVLSASSELWEIFCRNLDQHVMILWHGLQLHKVCRKLKAKYNFKYDINVIRSDLIYARILEQASKRSSYKTASEFLENTTKKFQDRKSVV